MKIGFDMDGVLSNFVAGFRDVLISMTGRDLLEAGDIDNPPVWNVWKHRGYTNKEISAAWTEINESPTFWRYLRPTAGANALHDVRKELNNQHEIYYITDRSCGVKTKRQTEDWLTCWVTGASYHPTVVISPHKGLVCKALSLDCYIDDKLAYIQSVGVESPDTRTYLLSYRYNQDNIRTGSLADLLCLDYTRVSSVKEFLQLEHLIP